MADPAESRERASAPDATPRDRSPSEPDAAKSDETPPSEAPPDDWLKDHESRQRESSDMYTSFVEAIRAVFPRGGLGGTNFYGPVQIDDWVSGDKHSGSIGSVFAGSGQVPASVLREVRDTFVHPERYKVLRQQLAERAVVILRAPDGWGRTTTALHALSEVYSDNVWKIRPEMDLTKLPIERLEPNRGYLAEHLELTQAARLRQYHLEEELAPKLRERGCYLIITIDPATELRDPSLQAWILDGGPPPDPYLIVSRHLAHRSSDSTDYADFMEREDVRSLVQESGRGGHTGRRLVELGALLVQVKQGSVDVDHIRRQLSAELLDELVRWFDGQPDTEQRAFLLSLAILNGMPQGAIFRISDSLAGNLHALESNDDDPPRPAFGTTRTAMLAAAEAELFDAIEHGRYGNRHSVGIRFRDDTYPLWVLEHVWNEYPYLRSTILAWICELGADPDRRVRVRAGVAAGLLSLSDFDLIRRAVLLPWAHDDRKRCREAALGALRVPAPHPDLAAAVNRMVLDWSRAESSILRWTAARALGSAVGSGMPTTALRVLGKLSNTDDVSLTTAVGDSLSELFKLRQEVAGLVLEALVKWTESEPGWNQRRLAAGGYFVVLGFDIQVEPDGFGHEWPALLWLAQQDKKSFDRVSTLVERVLDMPVVFVHAHQLLRQWITIASRMEVVRSPLERLVVSATARSDAGRRQLMKNLRSWRDEDSDLAAVSAALIAAIEERDQT